MRIVPLLTLALFAAVMAPAKEPKAPKAPKKESKNDLNSGPKKEVKLYAEFVSDTRVELSDGAMWMMDKGDVFPVVAYKNVGKSVILQLGGVNFMTETVRIRILKDDEVPAGLEAYRKNVRAYLESKAGKIQEELKLGSPVPSAGGSDLFP